jgi:hypothetical protein
MVLNSSFAVMCWAVLACTGLLQETPACGCHWQVKDQYLLVTTAAEHG